MSAMPMGNAQLPALSTKGSVSESSNFHGVVMWTIIGNDTGTVILQSPAGRGIVHLLVSPSTACDSSTPICLFSTVSGATNDDVFKVGDTARFSINPDSKQESVSLLTGTLAGFEVTVDLSKTWVKRIAHPEAAKANSTIANPASVYCIGHGGKLDIRATPNGQTGVCTFPNGSECEEWSYLKGECLAGSAGTNSTAMPVNSTTHRHFTVDLNETVGINTKS